VGNEHDELPVIWPDLVAKQMASGWFDFDMPFEDVPFHEVPQRGPNVPGERLPAYNGYHLVNDPGTIWTVVDGAARGWISAELFERVHYWEWCRWMGHNPRYRVCSRVWLTHVDNIDFILEMPPWNDDVRLVRNEPGTVCICETPRGEARPVLYVVPSERVMDWYQFDRRKVQLISDEEFTSYGVRTVLTMPDGST
jgi:hypothetical protein